MIRDATMLYNESSVFLRNKIKQHKETTIYRFKCTLKGHKFISNILNEPDSLVVYLTVMDVTHWEVSVRDIKR